MESFETKDYLLRLLNKNNPDEIKEVQKLRYDYLLREFDPSLPEGGIDDDGFDEYCDSIIVIHKATNKIVGTYRVATKETSKGHPFKLEEEFDISSIKNDPQGVVEIGRAVIHGDYRDGVVIGLIWKGIFLYGKANNCRYSIGTASFHGTDPNVHKKAFGYLGANRLDTKHDIFSIKNSFEIIPDPNISLAESEMPSLLKGYIALGAVIARNGFIDYEFNSCDVLIVIDFWTINERLVDRILRF